MKSRSASSLHAALLVATLALGACAAPSSFDGISGGGTTTAPKDPPKEDATVVAPRPVSPISVSFVSSSRPRLKWDLGAPGVLTGAVVEMARTRDFKGDVKSYPATGAELAVPEDLDLGVWFWRLKGATATAYGTLTSPTWEMVVRGPAKHGSSDSASRSMVDINGDGEPDLMVGGTVDGSDSDGPPVPSDGDGQVGTGASSHIPTGTTPSAAPSGDYSAPGLLYYAGDKDRGFVAGPYDGAAFSFEKTPYDGPMEIGAGTDLNGDGYTDIIESGLDSEVEDGTRYFGVNVVIATPKTDATNGPLNWDDAIPLYLTSKTSVFPSVREAGDVDGDGYGDAVVGLPDVSILMSGSPPTMFGYNATMPIYWTEWDIASTTKTSRVAMGGFDLNGDGLSDLVSSLSDMYEPNARAFAVAGDRTTHVATPRPIDAPDAKLASAFAAGDFNGDGLDDIAITTPVGDSSSRVCIWYGHRDKLVTQGPCVSAPAGEKSFGASLTAVDLEGDGIDELLATSVASGIDGVRAIRISAAGQAAASPIGVAGLGVRLTTIWPGRPGKGKWAAVAGDGSSVGVFEGSQLRTSMKPPDFVIRGFGRGLR